MRISQLLRKPSNWQDFERLCLMLWRSVWNSDDMKLNGRLGQSQNGVDICGHRSGSEGYCGIQCKCKKDGEKLTERAIQEEIENAKLFKPALELLIIATTAEKDAGIEEYVRLQNEELKRLGLFSLDIYSWEDIVFLLEENKSVLDKYLDIVSEDYDVKVCFSDYAEALETEVGYLKVLDAKAYKAYLTSKRKEYAYDGFYSFKEKRMRECNYSYFEVNLKIMNVGGSPIDEYKLQLWFDQDVSLAYTREKNYSTKNPIVDFPMSYDLSFEMNSAQYSSRFSLVPEDSDELPPIYVKAPMGTKELSLNWKLLSRRFNKSGELLIHIKENMHLLQLNMAAVPEKEWDVVEFIDLKEF